ncbi:MAG: hypothetical protein PVI01_15750 [Gemmatimonadales bacterium]|jgi:hypothetical protein
MMRPSGTLSEQMKRGLVALGVGVVVAALGVWAQNSALVGVNYDDGIYALLAKAVAAGEGYRLTYLPQDLPGIKYPPVYPLSLVPFWGLASSQEAALWAMKVWNGLLIGLAAGLFTLLLSALRILPTYVAAGVAVLGFAAGSIMLVTAGLLSEPTYLVVVFAALWAGDRIARDAPTYRVVAVGLLAALAVLTRAVGVAAVAAVVLGLWVRSGPRRATQVAAAAGALILPWAVYTVANAGVVPEALVPRYGSYVQLYLANLAGSPARALEIFWTNFGAILQTLGGKLVPRWGSVAQIVTGGSLIALAGLGSRIVWKRAPATVTYAWIYLAVISIWSFPPFRFTFILFPLLLALAAVSWIEVGQRLGANIHPGGRGRWLGLAWLGVGGVVAINLAYAGGRSLARRVWDGAELMRSRGAAETVEWVITNTPTDAVIAYEFDALVSLYTGRQTVPNYYEPIHVWYDGGTPPPSLEPLAQLLVTSGVDYLAGLRDFPQAARTIDSLLEDYPGCLELRFVTRSGVLIFATHLEALRTGATAPPDAAAGGSRPGMYAP